MGGGLIQSGAYDNNVPVDFMTFGARRRAQRPHKRTSVLGNEFDAGRGRAPQFTSVQYMSAAEKVALWKRFKMFLNALAKPSSQDMYGDGGSCPQNVFNAFSKGLYEHSHLHLGHIAHYDRLGYCNNYFNTYSGIEEYMSDLGEHATGQMSWGAQNDYVDLNKAMYALWLPMKQRIKWAWMGK